MSFLQIKIRHPQDFYGGVVLVVVALIAFWQMRSFPVLPGTYFTGATAPRLFAVLLGVTGAAIAVRGLVASGPTISYGTLRGPVLITVGILFFALTVNRIGLVLSSFVTIVIVATASREFRLVETLISAALLTAFCSALFVYVLAQPLPLWPGQ